MNCTSVQSRPASASASRAALMPYLVKLCPHLPQGCMPTPRIATSLLMSRLPGARLARRPPLPHDHVVRFGLVESLHHELHLHPDLQVRDAEALRDLTEH